MGMILAFAPFLAFALIDRLMGSNAGLVAGAIVAAILVLRDRLSPGRSPKILEIGTLLLFVALALYAVLFNPVWSVIAVRLCVDCGLLLIVLASMAARRPFTLQYAREQVAPEFWENPIFLRTNYVITAAWAAAFAVMVVAELALLYVPTLPPRAGIIAIVLAILAAVKFTGWYPERVRASQRG